jgi:hypothetical protein
MKVNGKIEAGTEIEVKRFYLPGVKIQDECRKCGTTVVRNYETQYLNYPTANEAFDETLYCEHCDREWDVKLILNVSLEAAS